MRAKTDRSAPPRAGSRSTTWVLALAALLAATAGMLALRGHLDKAHIALVYLLVVLGGSAAGGRALGLTLAGLAFLEFNFLFLPPYYTLAIEDPFDWLVLGAFLATSIVATQLLNRAQERAEEARQRATEVERLAMLGSETLNAGRAEDALGAIAQVIRSTLGVACVEILVEQGTPARITAAARAGACGAPAAEGGSLAAWVAQMGMGAEEHEDRTMRVTAAGVGGAPPEAWGRGGAWHVPPDTRALLVPLRVRDRTVGVLRIAHGEPIVLDPAQRQFLDALAYYAALGVERMRLVAEAERAEALRQADALKNALIAGVSHDFRTPLTTIKGLAHRLAQEGRPEAVSIEEEADRLNRIVADLLDLSRLSAGGLPVRVELNAVDDLVGAALRGVRGVAANRTIVPPRVGEAPPLFGTFDLAQSVRILVNLLENALKYSARETPIELSVAQRDGRLLIEVADRGPGIPDAERERVFEPFYRAPGVPPDVGGAGLGLTIARRLAEAQLGAVRYSPRAGGGSVFTLELPAAEPPVVR